MARSSFLFSFEKALPPATGTAGSTGIIKYRTTYSCVPRVAKFLGIENEAYTPDPEDKITRASYSREYTKADGTKGTLNVPETQVPYLAYGKANSRSVFVKTGDKTAQGTFKTLYFTFPSVLTVTQIGEALAETLPTEKVAAVGTVPTASQIEPFFTVAGGRKYPLPTAAKAETGTGIDLAKTEAEQVTVLAETKSRKSK